ncbi:hypothetical protein AM256_02865 [Burkholderia pseudomallei]|nr:hypothetical protein AM256_02865 [Burkholderia pseudomallei]ALB98712.1 hypothetical protein AM257_02860 [Burkholderia pseudomallei]
MRDISQISSKRQLSVTGLHPRLIPSRVFWVIGTAGHDDGVVSEVDIRDFEVQQFATAQTKLMEPTHDKYSAHLDELITPRILR